jgi:hypothetical protein
MPATPAVFRTIALAIAVAGVIDPAVTVSGASRARVALVTLRSAPPAANEVRARLVRELSASYEVVPHLTSDAAAAIVIGDRYPDGLNWPGVADRGANPGVPEALPIATVTTTQAVRSGARIVRVDSPVDIPPGTAIHLDVEIDARGVAGTTTDVIASLAGLETARASHRWTQDQERWHASLDVVPIGDPPLVVRVRLEPGTGGEGGSQTVADVVVDVRRDPLRVEFYDPRPSWATTFVRRALEADARFHVATLSSTSRGVFAQTGGAVAPGDARLDGFDAVVVGGLDRLSAADARALDRYMRERGGAVIVVPDQRLEPGPARDLLANPDLVERLLEQPARLTVTAPASPLQASELLVLRSLAPGSDIVARVPGADGSPVIASMPRGDGRLLLSGAMDAWRFRAADNRAFDRFWQSAIAGLALAVAPPVAVSVDPPILVPGEWGDVTVRVRSRGAGAVSASLDGDQPIRLIPDAEPGVYRGRFVARATPGRSTLEVRADDLPGPGGLGRRTVSRTLIVQADAHRVAPAAASPLALLSASHRGIDVTPEHRTDLERFLGSAVATPRAPTVRRPMRSTWWILPFAFCLSAEWWLRRQAGRR